MKGSFLISAIVGIDIRTTMDMDTTIKGFSLTPEEISRVFLEICSIEIDDHIHFELNRISPIRSADDYPGFRASLNAN